MIYCQKVLDKSFFQGKGSNPLSAQKIKDLNWILYVLILVYLSPLLSSFMALNGIVFLIYIANYIFNYIKNSVYYILNFNCDMFCLNSQTSYVLLHKTSSRDLSSKKVPWNENANFRDLYKSLSRHL